jgi:hypothetical protein
MLAPRGHQREVLDERPPERDVQDLHAPAHAEDRQLAVERPLDEVELERVAVRLGRAQALVRLLSVEPRVDVATAAEDKPVAQIEHVVEDLLDPRESHRGAAGERDRALEPDPLVVAEVVEADREADQRLPRPLHLDTYIGGF